MWRVARSSTQQAPSPPSSVIEMQLSNEPAFSLHGDVHRIQIGSSDVITAVAATGGLLWIGTASGRLIRYDSMTGNEEEVRGRLGVGKLDNAVWKIFADGVGRGALIVLKNVDGYHVSGKGSVRPRWLGKLRGLKVVSATWTRVEDRGVVLLGTEFGGVFCLVVDERNEREDVLNKLWNEENKERIEGIRVEYVGKRWVGVVVTRDTLYIFANADRLEQLFNLQVMKLERSGEGGGIDGMHFMSGNGVGVRRFVWAAGAGVVHAQLMVRRGKEGGIIANVTDVDTISWERLKEVSGGAIVAGVNLTAFHSLIAYPGSIFAFNQISGQLTQRVGVWNPTSETGREGKRGLGWEEGGGGGLQSAVGGVVRDVGLDLVWVWTEGGEIVRFKGGNGEVREAYVAAKKGGRFDVAMALAPVVGGDLVGMESREEVLEARGDFEANRGRWKEAAEMYAKTNRGVERVLLGLGGDVKVMTEYLVRKLDRVEGAMQRGVLAMLVVQLYAMVLKEGEVEDDFEGFLRDRWRDLDVQSATGVLLKSGCRKQAVMLALLSGEVELAAELGMRGGVEEGMNVLRDERVMKDGDLRGRVVKCLAAGLIERDIRKVGMGLGRVLRRGGGYMAVVREMVGVVRGNGGKGYEATTTFISQILYEGVERMEWGALVLILFQLHAEYGTENDAQRSYDHFLGGKIGKEDLDIVGGVLQSAASAGFLRLCVHLYWLLGMYEAAIQLAVEVDVELAERKLTSLGEGGKMLWCLVAKKSEDAVGVVERSRGVLHIEDVLPGMMGFEAATERVKDAVGKSLQEHQRGAQRARGVVVGALQVTRSLREDLGKVNGDGCGHGKKRGGECALCGERAIGGIDRGFEEGHQLVVGMEDDGGSL